MLRSIQLSHLSFKNTIYLHQNKAFIDSSQMVDTYNIVIHGSIRTRLIYCPKSAANLTQEANVLRQYVDLENMDPKLSNNIPKLINLTSCTTTSQSDAKLGRK